LLWLGEGVVGQVYLDGGEGAADFGVEVGQAVGDGAEGARKFVYGELEGGFEPVELVLEGFEGGGAGLAQGVFEGPILGAGAVGEGVVVVGVDVLADDLGQHTCTALRMQCRWAGVEGFEGV